jgi:hypothetical protein
MRLTAARLAAIVVALLLVLASRSIAAQDVQDAEIRKAVDQFCAWDFDGARLTSRNPHYEDAVSLLHGRGAWPEEPITIASSYRITAVHSKGDHGKVAVQYRLLAELQGGLETHGLVASRRRQTIWLPVSRDDANWKIDASELPPHVSVDAMRSHIAQIRRDDEETGDHHRRELLGTLISELGELGSQTGASRDLKPAPNQN